MAEAPAQRTASPGAAEAPAQTVLLVVIVGSPAVLDSVVTMLLDLGIAGTLMESKGLAALLREEMPIFSGLAALLPEATGNRTIMSVTSRQRGLEVLSLLEKEIKHKHRPVAFIVPVEASVGVRV